MFSKIMEIFRKENLLMQAYEMSYKMLDMALKMYNASVSTLRNDRKKEIKFNIYEYDRKVNEFEREIRKKVVTHMGVYGTTEIASELVLISIIIDIERIGDYTKNISELALNYPRKLEGKNYEEDLKKIENTIAKNFEKLIECLKECLIDEARKIMEENAQANKECDKIIDELIKKNNNKIKTREGISLALYVRYLKRISAHIKNIVSSIVNPFHNIGFKAEEFEENFNS